MDAELVVELFSMKELLKERLVYDINVLHPHFTFYRHTDESRDITTTTNTKTEWRKRCQLVKEARYMELKIIPSEE